MNSLRTNFLRSNSSLRTASRSGLPVRPMLSPVAARRGFAESSSSGPDKQQQKIHAQAAVGPFTYKAAGVFVLTGIALYMYFESEKAKVQENRRKEAANKSVGRPLIGGPFALTTHKGETFTEQDLQGRWSLIYFGFTHCPDICPEELDKMGEAVEMVDKATGKETVTPIFITVDPARDSLAQVHKYVQDFHPRMIGLVGDYEQVKKTCKMYRVYFSTPPDVTTADDYLVDHSIFFYLMDPLGQFVDAFGKATEANEVAAKVLDSIKKWEAAGGTAAAGVEMK